MRAPEPEFTSRISEPESPERVGSLALLKATRRLLPFLFFLYVLAYLDRINVSFAQLQMEEELGFSDAVYGFGASVFFIGFTLFEIPSNLMLRRVGARGWIARIMLSWGLISSGMALIETPVQFYLMRFALGAAEAGFFPGIILYLGDWFPDQQRARVISAFMTATAAAGVIGAPLSGYLLGLHGFHGLDGWQWLFLVEGIPSVLAGFAVFWLLPDSPNQATWLSQAEKRELSGLLARDALPSGGQRGAFDLMRSPQILRLGFFYFTIILSFNSLSLWMPQIIKGSLMLDNASVAYLTALPFVLAAIAMVFNGLHSDRSAERLWHVILPAFLGALGLVFTVFVQGRPLLELMGICLATVGVWATLGPFWTLPSSILHRNAAAVGFAFINSLGAVGGFIGPNLLALSKTYLGSLNPALLVLSVFLLAGTLSFRSRWQQDRSQGSLNLP